MVSGKRIHEARESTIIGGTPPSAKRSPHKMRDVVEPPPSITPARCVAPPSAPSPRQVPRLHFALEAGGVLEARVDPLPRRQGSLRRAAGRVSQHQVHTNGATWLWVKTNGIPFWGICAPPILGFISVRIGMFAGGMGF